MTKNEYRELMMDIIAMAIKEYEEEDTDYIRDDYTAGIIHGLRIAHRKLELSAFLTEEENEDE
jgi:hypothetical protein